MSKLKEYLLMVILRCVLLYFMVVLPLGRLQSLVMRGKAALLFSYQSSILESLVETRPCNNDIL